MLYTNHIITLAKENRNREILHFSLCNQWQITGADLSEERKTIRDSCIFSFVKSGHAPVVFGKFHFLSYHFPMSRSTGVEVMQLTSLTS